MVSPSRVRSQCFLPDYFDDNYAPFAMFVRLYHVSSSVHAVWSSDSFFVRSSNRHSRDAPGRSKTGNQMDSK